jgi:cellulose synthase/poly-beta-1,6-N-acetylglucosamine synthase-like glycosyltransferase
MEIVFWLLIGAVVWTYAGYPGLLAVMARCSRRRLRRAPLEPSVTLIIAAYNEERAIGRKLTNSLELDYPKDKLQIIVASDCSAERMHDIVREFSVHGVELVVLPERTGKTAAQNAAARVARGEILVFTDATTELHPRTIRDLVEGFADERVGCIGAELEYVSPEGTAVGNGGRAYWRYERAVKALEGNVNSLIGTSGCLYAVRASLYTPIDPDLISDFVIASEIFAKGYITVYGVGAVCQERTHAASDKEFDMRVRVAIRTIHALVRKAGMLNPLRYGFFTFQLFSHKVLRYLVPQLLLGALAANVWLALGHASVPLLYQVLLAGHLTVYLGAALGWLSHRLGIRLPLTYLPFYFVHANAAVLWAHVHYLRGERKVTWTTVR